MTLSVCMIVLNEEPCLARALDSIKDLADEIIIVDGGSTDKTKEIAKKYTDKVYDFPWKDDFSLSRNFSLSKATGDWILVLDADEVISHEDFDTITQFMKSDEYVAYALKQVSYTNDTSQYQYTPFVARDPLCQNYITYAHGYSGYIFCHMVRLFKNNKNIVYQGVVHESVDASCEKQGKIMKSDVWLHHYQFERGDEFVKKKQLHYLNIYENNIDQYEDKARAYRDIASVYFTHVKDYAQSLVYFKKSLALQKRNKKTYVGLGLSYVHLQNFQEALSVFRQGLKIFPSDRQLQHLKLYVQQVIERFIKD